ncbi:MAG: hypothetical protein M1834_003349 [Cirrosporium novae-zelandiae]|nr:MAG: hypothetical protein M1834_003349 [Cirrosporium novae-zelandiae]
MEEKNGEITKDVGAVEATVEPADIESTEEASSKTYSKLATVAMVVFSGLAIGSDAFNVSIVGQIELILAILYPDALTTSMYGRLSNAFMIGMIFGMIGFGYLSDKIGRKSGAVMTTIILTVGIAMSAGASGNTPTGLLWMLVISRGIAGVGAGGEYPVAGAGAAEATDETGSGQKNRGFIFAIIADTLPCLGFVFSGIVPILLILCFHQDPAHYDKVWRISLALAAIPPLSIFWFRYKMVVSTAYKKSAMKKQRVPYLLAFKKYWRNVLSAGLTWGLYNYVAYPFGLFSSTIISQLGIGDSMIKNLGWGAVINCFYIPGSLMGGLLSDRIGRRKTMTIGFLSQAVLGFILGGLFFKIEPITPLFIVFYGIFLTLGELGPGATVVIVASESFPTSIRGQGMGLAAAMSKAGGAIGTSVFKPILAHWGDDSMKGTQAVFLIGSAFSCVGAAVAFFMVPDVDKRLGSEDEVWKRYLEDHGYEIEWGTKGGEEEDKEAEKVVKS